MHRPIAGPVQVSLPSEDVAEIGLAGMIDLSIGALACLAAASVWVVAFNMAEPPDPYLVLAQSCVALLVPSVIGLWLMQQADRAPRLAVTGIYESVFRRLAQGDRLAIPVADQADGYRGLASLIVHLAATARQLQAGRDRARQAMETASHALAKGRGLALDLSSRIARDTDSLTEAAARADASTNLLCREIAATSSSFELADDAVGRAVGSLTDLACAVRTTTASAEQMTSMAVQMSQVAHDTQASIAILDDRTATLALSLDQVARALVSVRVASQAEGGESGDAPAASDILAIALGCQTALEEATTVLKGLIGDTGEASRRVAEISELVRSNHEVGYGIGHAVQQQGQDIADILQQIYEARSGFVAIRAGVEAVGRAGATSAAVVTSLRDTAQRLPSHAETMASILRDMPDFAPDYK